jgi:RNA polymerase sigma-B factor
MVSTRTAGVAAVVKSPRTDAPHDFDPEQQLLLEKFRRYRRTEDTALQQELVCHYLPLAKRIARRYVRVGVPLDDLTQIGTIGLMNAVSSFDPARGVKFEAYAYHHIAGEIRHYLRDSVEPVRAPRWVRKLYGELTQAVAELRQSLGRTPTLAEIAARMNLTETGVLEILRAHNRSRVHSISELVDRQETQRDMIAHQRYISFQLPVEDRIILLKAVERLADLQRKVVYYLFYQDLTQSEVAKRLGVSQRHVSRVLAAALKRLATHLKTSEVDHAMEPAPEEVRQP